MGACVRWDERMCGNPMMTFPSKTRIKTKQFIDRMSILCIGDSDQSGDQ